MPSLRDLVEKGDVNFDVDYLSSEDKERMVADKIPFTIINVDRQERSTYGPAWNIELILEGEERTMTLSAGGSRDQYMHDLHEVAAVAPITEAYLVKRPTKMGRDAYVISESPE